MKTRKMTITDEAGNKYQVEEEIDEDPVVDPQPEPAPAQEKVELTDDEIKALKDLAACSADLMALAKGAKHDEEPKPEPTPEPTPEPAPAADPEPDEDDDTIIETHDSFSKGAGATEKHKVTKDTALAREESINAAWTKRFKGE